LKLQTSASIIRARQQSCAVHPAAFRNCTRHICPPVVWPVRDPGQGNTRLKQTMDPPLPPESALLATKSRAASSRLFRPGSARAAAACGRAPHVGPGLGEVAAGRSRGGQGSGAGGGGRRLTARNLRPYAYLNRRRKASLIRPAKRSVSRLAEVMRDFGTIVRCRGRSSGWLAWPRGKPAGREPGPRRLHLRAVVVGWPAGRWN